MVPTDRIAVYSCLTNGYDRMLPPTDPVPGVDHILFTDQPDRPVPGWQTRPLASPAGLAPGEANRYHKVMAHAVLPDHGASLYLDSNIRIKASLAPLLDSTLAADPPLAVYAHPRRSRVAEEAEVCLAMGRTARPERLQAELARYAAAGFPDDGTLTGNSILIRRHHDPRVIAAMALWWDLLTEGSGRDQISLPYVRWSCDLPVTVLTPHFSLGSPYFQRYPHWKGGGLRARAFITAAAGLTRPGPAGWLAAAAHHGLGLSYGREHRG